MAKLSEAARGNGAGTRTTQPTDIARAFPFDMATARRIGDLLPVAMYCCDAPSGRITFYNAQAATLWGREPDIGATDERFCGSFRLWRPNGELLPHDQTPMAFALREGCEFRNEDVIIERPDGSRIRVLVNIDPIRDAGGRVMGAVNVFHDVTALQEANDALRDSEQRFRTMIDALPAAIYTTDAQGRLTHFNPAAVKFSGRTPELGTDQWCVSWKLYHPDGTPMPHDQCPMAIALREGRAVRGAEAIAERPDGTRLHFEPYPTPLRDAAGHVIGGINMLMDVTQSKLAQEALRASQSQLSADAADSKLLQELSAAMTEPGNLQALEEKILDAAIAIMRSDMASMQMLDEEADALRMLAYRGFEPSFGELFELNRPDTRTSCSLARRTGRRVVMPDVESCEYIVGTAALQAHREAGICAVQSTPLYSRGGKLLGVISTHWREPHHPSERDLRLLDVLARQAADLLDRKSAEIALRHRTRQFETLLNQAPLGVYLVDAAFAIREVNPIAARTFGDIPGGVVGRNFDEIIRILWDGPYADEIVRIFRHTLATGEPYVTAERAEVRRDLGITEYYEWRLDRITLPDGRHGVVCYFREISAQVRARQAIAESERQFRQIADSMPQIVWTARPDGYIDYYNERWYEYTGFARGEYGQASWEPILHPDDVQHCIDTYFGCIRTQQPYQIEYRFKDARSGGYRWFMGRALPIRDERGQVSRWFGTCTDIDDAKKAAESLRESNELLSRFNRLAVDRELRMIELKKEVNGLCRQHGQVPRYPLKFESDRQSDADVVVKP